MDYRFSKQQENLSNTPKKNSFIENENFRNSFTSFESSNVSGPRQGELRSSIDLDIEAGQLKWNDTKNNFTSESNFKVSQAYFGADQPYSAYFEEFTTQNPIDFDIELKESSEAKYEEKSSSSSSLSKSSKKISKIQKEELPLRTTPYKTGKSKGKKNPWQPSEDAKVIELVSQCGQSWALIAAALGNRTGKQVRDRYLNYLRADIKGDDFTVSEDRLLLSLYYQMGHKWSRIASHMPGRTECQVKNRFYAHIKKRLAFPDFPENKNYQRNIEDLFCEEETLFTETKDEIGVSYGEKKEHSLSGKKEETIQTHKKTLIPIINPNQGFYPILIADPTDVISYENKNRSFTQINHSVQSNMHTYYGSISTNENFQSTAFDVSEERKEMPTGFLSSFNNISSYCDNALFKTDVKYDTKVEHGSENNHKHALSSLENEVNSQERAQRYEELVRRKKALEFFYNKTLKEMNDLGISDFSTPKAPN